MKKIRFVSWNSLDILFKGFQIANVSCARKKMTSFRNSHGKSSSRDPPNLAQTLETFEHEM